MEILLKTYYILLPVVATALLGWVGTLLSKQQKKEEEDKEKRKTEEEKRNLEIELLKQSNVSIERYMLKRYHTEYMMQGYVTYSQFKEFKEMYDIYTGLGGNGTGPHMMRDIENLPMRDDEEGLSIFAQEYLKHKHGSFRNEV